MCECSDILFGMWGAVMDMWKSMLVLGITVIGFQIVTLITLIDKRGK